MVMYIDHGVEVENFVEIYCQRSSLENDKNELLKMNCF